MIAAGRERVAEDGRHQATVGRERPLMPRREREVQPEESAVDYPSLVPRSAARKTLLRKTARDRDASTRAAPLSALTTLVAGTGTSVHGDRAVVHLDASSAAEGVLTDAGATSPHDTGEVHVGLFIAEVPEDGRTAVAAARRSTEDVLAVEPHRLIRRAFTLARARTIA